MAAVTQPLREEHQGLLPHILRLRTAADGVGVLTPAQLGIEVDACHDFLTGHLLPHAMAEDAALYPVVEQAMGAPGATATMRRDHVAVQQLVDELGKLRPAARQPSTPATERDLRRVLYGLFTLVGVHFAKEEEIYLPLLDQHLNAKQADAMFAHMERAAAETRSGGAPQ